MGVDPHRHIAEQNHVAAPVDERQHLPPVLGVVAIPLELGVAHVPVPDQVAQRVVEAAPGGTPPRIGYEHRHCLGLHRNYTEKRPIVYLITPTPLIYRPVIYQKSYGPTTTWSVDKPVIQRVF